jgi:energy-coupling factor transport system ATP-binding protein
VTVPLITVRDLWHTYMRGTPLETVALRGVSFAVHPGEVIGLIGPTGSGKSTLLQHLNGLLRPEAGAVHVGELDLADRRTDLRAVRMRVALLFQNPEDQLFEQYVADDVAYGPLQMGLHRDEVRARVRRAMAAVGLPAEQYGDRLTQGLSGGERRRAALAGVLALEPQVLVLDEPTVGLDPRGRRELIALLQGWHRQGERAIVWATHAMEEVALLAGRIVVLAEGQVALEGSPRQVFGRSQALAALGLEVPAVRQVVDELVQAGLLPPSDVLTVEEAVPVLETMVGRGISPRP